MARSLRRYMPSRKGKRRLMQTALGLVIVAAVSLGSYEHYHMNIHVDQTKYAQLLETIAKGESNGNYNAFYGDAGNTKILFTDMTIQEVLLWQEAYVRQGAASSAVGKYQFMPGTLRGLIAEQGISEQVRFDETLQDRLAIALLERRGSIEFVSKKMPKEQFAANLAKEWAALPRILGPNPEQSYYAGDGLNKVQVSIADVYRALEPLES